MGKSRVVNGIRLYEHYVEPGQPIGSYWQMPEWYTAQTSEGILHYCRQNLQFLINSLVEPKLGVTLPRTLSLEAGIIQSMLEDIYDALTFGLQLPSSLTQEELKEYVVTHMMWRVV